MVSSCFQKFPFLVKDSVSLTTWVQAELTQGIRPHRALCQPAITLAAFIFYFSPGNVSSLVTITIILSTRELVLQGLQSTFTSIISFNHFLLYILRTYSWYLFSITACLVQ